VAGVYISWPFCAQKCSYCNFASGVLPREMETSYLDRIVQEIAGFAFRDTTAETVYLGGGTPSGMSPGFIRKLLSVIPGKPWREGTMEAAPGSFDEEKISAWVNAGIDRVSLGVQSFIRGELARTGRRHDAQVVERDVIALRAGGIRNFNIDLIAGLPGQTEASWRESVSAAIRLDPPHVSVYMLEVDEDSRLGSEILLGGSRYGAHDVPSDDAIADFYEIAVRELARAGILRYEISNFARPGAESAHNLKYWRREPYFGFGADAHSFDGLNRWQNPETAADYLASSGAEQARSTPDPLEEKFFVGLRLSEGVETAASDWLRYGTAFERFLAEGVMEQSGNRLRLTSRGVMVSNEIFEEFVTV
jgi:oxygen-independent coproporphyrinogen-3 oxidase